MKKILRNPNGFTLVELMVVVAIIGILSAIAVPNFKKYQAKSKQSEAKIQLASIYNSEVGTLADYDTYATCLGLMGYEQMARGYYAVGFVTAYAPGTKWVACTAGGNTAANSVYAPTDKSVVPFTQRLAVVTANAPASVTLPTALASQTAFKAGAEASIANNTSALVDKWSIDQNKALTNDITGY